MSGVYYHRSESRLELEKQTEKVCHFTQGRLLWFLLSVENDSGGIFDMVSKLRDR